ncbi:hypothetical protein RHMOL_Rhmol08G0009000 [Rhododendron molle]|uniref:Uncharacterized protein n=1 Tax=Rhododendron molle TaxID=49168 RepID=A0ACC0MIY6_RHOML|nr:hypothetical protein RHMOL_Rhmol08G0009000 [Rhododendron molle]
MFDLGDELIIGSQRIPWLIWIQLLVMLLLIILLYYFTVSALGLDPSATAAAASTSTVLLASGSAAAASTSRVPNIKVRNQLPTSFFFLTVGEGNSIKDDIGTSTRRKRIRTEDIQEREGSSYHPCHYFGLAKQAFLKCLGLDPTSKDSSNSRHRKEE